LCSHREAAREMGANARDAVANITWDRVVNGLLKDSGSGALPVFPKRQALRKKMVVAVTFPIYPPRGGGQARIYHLYRYLAEHFDIEILSLCAHGKPEINREIAPGLREIRVPVSVEHQLAEKQLSKSVGNLPVTDIVADQLIDLTPEYLEKMQVAVAHANVVVACHPYLGKRLSAMNPRADFWLEAQDVEYLLKKDILPDNEAGRQMLETVKEAEAFCWRHASTVFTCALQDIDALTDLYGASSAKTMEVANGVSIEDVPFVDGKERQSRKAKIGLSNSTVALFMGSWHGPNIEAAEHILEYAETMPAVIFIILGSVCGAIANRKIPANVKLLGVVDDNVKAVLLGTADVALNPMASGSGSNLKMLDYFAAGIPVISTAFGARGINVIAEEHYLRAEVQDFPERLANLPTTNFDKIAFEARKLAETQYSWPAIVNNFVKCVKIG
jgi:glycosyltransferase involved in cell wall biosynthesis